MPPPIFDQILDSGDPSIYKVVTRAPGPEGMLPVNEDMLLHQPSGHLFGMSQNAGMGWEPSQLRSKEFLLLSTQGGVRSPDGKPVALGYHIGHWEVGLLVEAAAGEFNRLGCVPFAGFCTDPCDGRTQGTPGMMDSLPYRNDAALVLGRLIRSHPTRRGVMGIATCDKGLPAMMMALAAARDLPGVIVPGGVALPPIHGEDAAKAQSLGARYALGEISLEEAARVGCNTCASPGGGCQFLGTAATSQVVAEALGMSVVHSALAPSGQPVWQDLALRSARALYSLEARDMTSSQILSESSIKNAMTVFAAFGGSTNLLLHLPAIAFAAGLTRPKVQDWIDLNRKVPRLVDVLPNGPVGHPTVRAFLAGGVPEVMLHLRRLNLLEDSANTVSGCCLGELLDWWETSERRERLKDNLYEADGVDPEDVIMSPPKAREKGLTGTLTFPTGNLAPEGAVIKSTALDPAVVDPEGVYRHTGPARVFPDEDRAIQAIKRGEVRAGDVMVLICRGPLGAGMPETFQITSALKYLSFGKHVALLTDGRFSGVSTGACIGHIGAEALAGGPIGKVLDDDLLEIIIDLSRSEGSVNLVGHAGTMWGVERGTEVLSQRPMRSDLASAPDLPDDTRLWAMLQNLSGGTWGGCVYDLARIADGLALR